ncbi:MAG: 13E12 repeat family protein [Actinomycetota bacterium]|nr:13E12 repeat family protein [Actinomycetota bacterium]
MTVAPTAETHDVLSRAEANLAESRRLGFERLQLAREWARLHDRSRHPDLSASDFTELGAEKREVYEYAAAELGLALELHPLAAQRLMADAVDLAERLPYVWAALGAGRLEDWVGRKIARVTRELRHDQAIWVDTALADVLGSLPPGRLLTVVEARVLEADQARADRLAEQARRERLVKLGRDNEHGVRGLAVRADAADALRFYQAVDHLAHLLAQHGGGPIEESIDELRARAVGILANPLTALRLLLGAEEHDTPERVANAIRSLGPAMVRPRSILYVHIDPGTLDGRGVARAEELGALTRNQLIRLLGHEHVTVRPVIDLAEQLASDNYEVPARISEHLHLTKPADVFPYAESLSRQLDQDHTIAYRANGPPGQTVVDNLGKLTRRHHRVKTHAGWTVEQRSGGVYVWTTPHECVRVTDRLGTHRVMAPATVGYGDGLRVDLRWTTAA